MDTPECENFKERKRTKKSAAPRKKATATVKLEDESRSCSAGEQKLKFDDTLLQHLVFTEILNAKKRELLENEVILNNLYPFKREPE